MTVRELIEHLSKLNGDDLVVLSRDAQGNSYAPLSHAEGGMKFDADTGEIGYVEITDVLAAAGYTDEDLAPDEAKPCVVLVSAW